MATASLESLGYARKVTIKHNTTTIIADSASKAGSCFITSARPTFSQVMHHSASRQSRHSRCSPSRISVPVPGQLASIF